MPADEPAPRRTAGDVLRDIDHVDTHLDAIVELLQAAGTKQVSAASIAKLLAPVSTLLGAAAEDLDRLLGR